MAIEMWNNQSVIFRRPQGDSDQSTVAALPNGNYVVVWRDKLADKDGKKGICFQVVDAAGELVGSMTRIPVADPFDPEVTTNSGLFNISWSDGAKRIDWAAFDVNTGTIFGRGRPVEAADGRQVQSPAMWSDIDENKTVSVWADTSEGTNAIQVEAWIANRPYRTSVNTGTGAKNPDVTGLANGKLVVVFSEGSNSDIKAVIVDNITGASSQTSVTIPLGAGITDIIGKGASPVITAISDDFSSFLITYRDGSGSLRARKFNGDGVAVPEDLIIDSDVTLHPFQVVELTKGGFDNGFAVAYSKTVNGQEKLFVKLVKYDDASIDPVAVQPPGAGAAKISSITELADGRISIVWDTPSDSNGAGGIYSRIIDARETAVTVDGTNGADYYIGTKFTGDVLNGSGGDDRLEGGAGGDRINGGEGNNTAEFRFAKAGVAANLRAGVGTEGDAEGDRYTGIGNLYGSNYDDLFVGNPNANRLTGAGGNDLLDGDRGADILDGGAGNDTLIGGLEADIIDGGSGTDTADYSAALGVTVNLASGRGSGSHAEGDTYSGIENVIGSRVSDIFLGNGAANTFRGGDGNDVYHVGAGDVVVEGVNEGNDKVVTDANFTLGANVEILEGTGAGALVLTGNGLSNTITGNAAGNWIDGGAGADTMAGGAGDDTYVIDNAGDRIVDGQGNDSVVLTVSYDLALLPSSVKNITAAEGLVLDLTGTNGANVLMGNAAANTLKGQGGNDTIYGKAANDKLYGGTGKDVFVFDTALHKTRNVDRIYDYKSKDDSVWLDNKVFTKLGSGTASRPKKFKADMFTEGKKAQDREDRIVYDKKTGALYYDKDGTGGSAQVKIATLSNKTTLKFDDFFVI
jgi:Ca2+-binding RTX toxin-like protein